jgi:hypothetical protein
MFWNGVFTSTREKPWPQLVASPLMGSYSREYSLNYLPFLSLSDKSLNSFGRLVWSGKCLLVSSAHLFFAFKSRGIHDHILLPHEPGSSATAFSKNKSLTFLFHKTILKPSRTYGIQLWGTASTSNIEILERFQSKVLRMIVDAPWCVLNSLIRRDLTCPTVKEEIRHYSSYYGDRLRTHPNHLAVNLLRLPDNRRLRRFLPTDLPDRF